MGPASVVLPDPEVCQPEGSLNTEISQLRWQNSQHKVEKPHCGASDFLVGREHISRRPRRPLTAATGSQNAAVVLSAAAPFS